MGVRGGIYWRVVMEGNEKDEILEEIWEIKKQFSSRNLNDLEKIIQEANEIAKKEGFPEAIDGPMKRPA